MRTKQCLHGWALPNDAWQVHRQLDVVNRTARCRLCGLARLEKYDKSSKTWKPVVQMEMYFEVPGGLGEDVG